MEHLSALGTAIKDVAKPTFQLYAPLLIAQADTINSVPKQTHSFGPHPRQQLDLYTPPSPRIVNGRQAVLIFFYGGGLVMGDKTLDGFADNLCHANIASFFARKYGYTVIVPDYRLVGKHGAVYPSGGEDVALAVQWVCENASTLGSEPVDLFLMGNSAGGIHVSTFLLEPALADMRAPVLSGGSTRLRGAVMLSVPFSFDVADSSRMPALDAYYGKGEYKAKSPVALLRAAQAKGDIDFISSGVRLFVLNGDLDPEDEILIPRDYFLRQWEEGRTPQSRRVLAVDSMPGHNHISPFASLGTATEEEEAWGHQVGGFCDNIRRFKPSVGK